jgi:hypothetical protein
MPLFKLNLLYLFQTPALAKRQSLALGSELISNADEKMLEHANIILLKRHVEHAYRILVYCMSQQSFLVFLPVIIVHHPSVSYVFVRGNALQRYIRCR